MIESMLKAAFEEDESLNADDARPSEAHNSDAMADVIAHVGGQISTLAVKSIQFSRIYWPMLSDCTRPHRL